MCCCQNTTSRNVHLLIELNGYRTTFICSICILVTDQNALYLCMLIAWQGNNIIANGNASALDLSLKTTECMIRTAYTLYRHIKALFLLFLADINVLKI